MTHKIGMKIKNIRKSLGLSMEDFGKLFNPAASKGVISNWENDYNKPNNERLKKIAELGNISVSELLNGNDPNSIKKSIEEIVTTEINQYGNEKYKLLYNPKYKELIIQTTLSNYNFDNLSELGTKQYLKQILDTQISKIQELQKYTPYSNENAVNYSYDLLWDAMKKIDEYFMDEGVTKDSPSSYLEKNQIKHELSSDLYDQVRIAFENLSVYLRDLDKNISRFDSKSEIDTLAAHSANPDKIFNDDEIDNINAYLDQLDEEYDSKHKK